MSLVCFVTQVLSTLRDSVPGARQEAPQSSALRLCRPPLRYAPSTPLPLRSKGGNPSSCTCRPCWRGPGPRRVCEQTQHSHSKTEELPHDLHRDILPGRQQTQAIQLHPPRPRVIRPLEGRRFHLCAKTRAFRCADVDTRTRRL